MTASIDIQIMAGSSIESASADAQRVADILGLNIGFTFNDVQCLALPGGDADVLAEKQQIQQGRKATGPFDRRFARSVP